MLCFLTNFASWLPGIDVAAVINCYQQEYYLPLYEKSMTVIVNNSKIRIFNGARVGDAVLRWAVRNRLDIDKVSSLQVTDKWGHNLGFEAPLSDEQIINC